MELPDHPLFDELKKLALPAGDYAVFGSGPLWVRDIRDSHDLDLIARGDAWKKAVAAGQLGTMGDTGRPVVRFPGGSIEVFDNWYPGEWNIDEIIDAAETVGGIPFAKLDAVIEWKRRMGREKDFRDLDLIKQYLSSRN